MLMKHAKKKCLYESINVTIIIRKKNTTNGILKILNQPYLEFRNTATFHLASIPSLAEISTITHRKIRVPGPNKAESIG